MGIESRDYVRPSYGGGWSSFGGDGTTCKRLIIANVAVFLLQVMTFDQRQQIDLVTLWCGLDIESLKTFQVWRLVTYAFIHSVDYPFHILFNMLFLWWFGRPLEGMYGHREFLAFYLAAAVISGACFLLIDALGSVPGYALGASGAVCAVLMVFALYYPRHTIMIWFVIPIEIWLLVTIYFVLDLIPVLSALSRQEMTSGVAHAAHVGGMVFGFAYQRNNWRVMRLFDGLPQWRLGQRRRQRARTVKLHVPPAEPQVSEDLDGRVDQILQKIHEQGEASLTNEERETLRTASTRAKNRLRKG